MASSTQKLRRRALISQNGRCYYCRCAMWQGEAQRFAKTRGITERQAALLQCTAEHLVARQDNGRDRADNIVAACRFCNQSRHARKEPPSPEAFRQLVQRRLQRGKWFPFRMTEWLGQ